MYNEYINSRNHLRSSFVENNCIRLLEPIVNLIWRQVFSFSKIWGGGGQRTVKINYFIIVIRILSGVRFTILKKFEVFPI